MTLVASPIAACRVCPQQFERRSSLHCVCSPKCALIEAKQKAAAARQDRAQTRQKLEAMKPRREWLAEAQTAVNRFCRLRDIKAGYGCITCGAKYYPQYGGAFDAGHMISRGSAPHLRFRTDNIALQCVKDNRYLGGKALEFRAAMIQRIGIQRVEALESMQGPAKFTIPYLRRLKKVFTKRGNQIEKALHCNNAP